MARDEHVVDTKGHKHELKKGDCVDVRIASGVNSHKTGAKGWSLPALVYPCLKLR